MQKIVSFVLSEGIAAKKGEVLAIPISESAPHYFGASVPKQLRIDKEERKVGDRSVVFEIKSYAPDVMVAEAQVEVPDVFSEEAFDLRAALIDECHKVIKRRGGRYDTSEEYSIAIVSDYKGDPDQFLKEKAKIARFLKSEKLPLDEDEITRTLASQLKYAKDDLVVVDWDGAFIFDPYGEYESIVELLQIANLQLLRYRMLDSELEEWKAAVKEKLDSLEDVYSIVAENFSMSRVTYLEFIQIILFFILQLGWFVLIGLEIWYYTK